MLRLLLSPDQYAAALLCGSKIQLKAQEQFTSNKQDEKGINSCKQGSKQTLKDLKVNIVENQLIQGKPILNHLEKIDEISENEQKLEYYVSKFLCKLKTSQQLSDVDLRIRDSMIDSLPTKKMSSDQNLKFQI